MAILMADVAGYSRLIGADDEGTFAQLNAHHSELVEPKVKEHRGRVARTTGEGLLVLFASAVDALRCAVDIQRVHQNLKQPATSPAAYAYPAYARQIRVSSCKCAGSIPAVLGPESNQDRV